MFDVDQEGQEKTRGRGRPPGVKNGEGKPMAPIVKWTPRNDFIVHLHITMHSDEEIAERVGVTPQRVNQILNDPTAKGHIRDAQERLRAKLSQEVADGLAAICVKALDNIRTTIELEGLAHGSDFKKHQDKMSLEVLKGQGFLSKEKERDEATELPADLVKRLSHALEKSVEATEYLQSKEIVVEEESETVHEGDFVLVE